MAVDRITMFKLKEEDIPAALEAYKTMVKDAKKDGKPYILSAIVRTPHPDPRSKGFTVVAQTGFASLEDMLYYDSECPAHKNLKMTMGPKIADPTNDMMTLYFDKGEPLI